MKWSFAYDFVSIGATVSSISSESSPDGLAENCVVPSGTSLGMSWVTDPGDTHAYCNLTFDDPVAANFVVIIGANYSDAAVVTLFLGPTIIGEPRAHCSLVKCLPANVWAGSFTTVNEDLFTLDISDADAPAAGLETPLILFGTRVDIANSSVGRPGRGYSHLDPSTRAAGQTGAVWTAKQRRQFRQAFSVTGHNDTDGIADLRAMWASVGRSALVVSMLDADDLAGYGNTNVGIIENDLSEAIGLGMTTGFDVSVLEVVA